MIYRISEDVREEKVANIDTECYNHENEKKDELRRKWCYEKVIEENPEFSLYMWMYTCSIDGQLDYVEFTYEYTEEVATIHANVNAILSPVEEDWSDVEKAFYIHDYMTMNYKYDENYSIYHAAGMLLHGTGVCQSYAETYQYLMNLLGIECVIATSWEMNHAWNMIKIDGEWYHVDVTWDDPLGAGGCYHDYFLRSDEGI